MWFGVPQMNLGRLPSEQMVVRQMPTISNDKVMTGPRIRSYDNDRQLPTGTL
jgi:hypothetical protein